MVRSLLTFIVFLSIILEGRGQSLYFVVESNNLVHRSPLQVDFVKKNRLKEAVILYQDDFVTHDLKQNFSKEIMNKNISLRFPNKNSEGIGLLDWEGSKAQILYGAKKVSEKQFNSTVNEFISALRYAKQLRPNVKWSFYGLPVRVLNNHTYSDWKSKVMKLKPLFNEMDYICPNLYLFLRSDKTKYDEDIKQHINLALKIGKDYNKPVLGLVWHRYQTNSELVDPVFFKSYINKLSQFSYQGKKLSGIIWWNSEGFNYKRKSRYPKINQEYKAVSDDMSYQKSLLSSYLGNISPKFK